LYEINSFGNANVKHASFATIESVFPELVTIAVIWQIFCVRFQFSHALVQRFFVVRHVLNKHCLTAGRIDIRNVYAGDVNMDGFVFPNLASGKLGEHDFMDEERQCDSKSASKPVSKLILKPNRGVSRQTLLCTVPSSMSRRCA